MYVCMRKLCYCWSNHEARNSIHEVTAPIRREWAKQTVHWCSSWSQYLCPPCSDCLLWWKIVFLTVTYYFGTSRYQPIHSWRPQQSPTIPLCQGPAGRYQVIKLSIAIQLSSPRHPIHVHMLVTATGWISRHVIRHSGEQSQHSSGVCCKVRKRGVMCP
ncbi:hypothetical protein L207DRAFT_114308 [Hyaloscypha variabilis F]|uniref:Uncharacterized protein n=1 Tax=Hyaloscypha variabilis (strain UAMH 11265 / GT02V1 / F) TaxID=1149755 RepID=A0A2J6RA69_HYAVF|nr:hypothetical protein L207DRAFT_114308 [Hyaloscypha variabilis F]